MDNSYIDTIRSQVESIFARGPYFDDLPNWPIYNIENKDEQKKVNAELQYNMQIAKHLNGLCLDQKLIYPEGNTSGIESCDILLPKGIFVHVKHISSSAPASHLLAQALVSADLLSRDPNAQQQLQKLINKIAAAAGKDASLYESKPRRIVIVMAKNDKLLTAESLFTFTKINLVRHDQRLASMSVKLNIAPVIRKNIPQLS